MAEASIRPQVTEHQVVVVESEHVALKLTMEEAQFLRDLLYRHVGGDPNHSRRKFSTTVGGALAEAGVKVLERDFDAAYVEDSRGSVTFLSAREVAAA